MRVTQVFLILSLLFSGCGTYVHEDGQRALSAFGDYDELEFRTPKGTALKARRANHSKPTRDAINAVSQGAVGIIGAGATGAIIK